MKGFTWTLVSVVLLVASVAGGAQEETAKGKNFRLNLWVGMDVGYFGKIPAVYTSIPPAPGVHRPYLGVGTGCRFSVEPEYVLNDTLSIAAIVPVGVVLEEPSGEPNSLPSLLFPEPEGPVVRLGDIIVDLRYSPVLNRRSGLRVDLSFARDMGTSKNLLVGDGYASTKLRFGISKPISARRILYVYGEREKLDRARAGIWLYSVGIYQFGRDDGIRFGVSLYDSPAGTDLQLQLMHDQFTPDGRLSKQWYLQILGVARKDRLFALGFQTLIH